jgi:hypothetical protein
VVPHGHADARLAVNPAPALFAVLRPFSRLFHPLPGREDDDTA